MARFPRFNQSHRPQRSDRQFNWIGGIQTAFDAFVLAAGGSQIISSVDTRVTGAIAAPYTVTRVRGYLTVWSDQVAGAEFPHGAFGYLLVNGEAFDAGVASIPTPFSEAGDGRWLYHAYWACPSEIRATDGLQTNFFNHTIDGKGQRKVVDGDVLLAVIENGSTVGGVRVIQNGRVGIKLH